MNLFGMEKHHTKSLWLLAILIAFSTTVCAQGTSVTGRGNHSIFRLDISC